MRIIVCGDRYYTNYDRIYEVLTLHTQTGDTIIQGECRGADLLGKRYATENGLHVECFPADWKTYGKRAGPGESAIRFRVLCGTIIISHLGGDEPLCRELMKFQ